MKPYLFILAALLLADLVIRIGCLFVVPRNRRPNSANAWLLTIFSLPFIGWFLFLIIGSYKLPKSRREKQALINQLVANALSDHAVLDNVDLQWLPSLVKLNRNLGSMPMVAGTRVHILTDTSVIMEQMVSAIDSAKSSVHVEFYIFSLDEFTQGFFTSLENATARGVKVRVLYDHIATLRVPGYLNMKSRLKRNGIEFYPMLPIQPFKLKYQRPDLRNHRKLLVIDDAIAFVGSLNIIDPFYNTRGRKKMFWQDAMLRLEGPVISGISAVFVSDWYAETGQLLRDYRIVKTSSGDSFTENRTQSNSVDRSCPSTNNVLCQVVPSGPGFEGENNLQLFLMLLYASQKRVAITSPYFVPDEAMTLAIASATKRGVSVELFLSENHDQKIVYHAQCSYYEQLLRSGVKIWLYRAPNFLHSKYVTVDDDVAVFGSSNFDMRSFNLNMEMSLLLYSKEFVAKLQAVEQENRANSSLLTLDEWMHRGKMDRLKDNLARLTSALQ